MAVIFNDGTFDIINVKAKTALLYITQDPSWNIMHFIFTNNTGINLDLTGGKPVDRSIPGAASTLLFDFSEILTEEEVKAIKVTDDTGKWDFSFFPGDEKSQTPPGIGIAPRINMSVPADASVIFTITGITCQTTIPDNFEVNYFNFVNVDPDPFGLVYHLAVIKPPSGNLAPLNCSFFNPIHPIDGQPDTFHDSKEEKKANTPIPVYITYDNDNTIKNGFVLYLTNTGDKPLVSSGNSSLVISFLFGQSDYAITSQSLGDNIKMDFVAKGTAWEEKAHTQSSSNWIFVPQSKVLLEAHETIKFNITNIITLLNANPDTISTLYVQIQSILNYDDTVLTIDMVKLNADVPVPDFTVTPPATIDVGQNVLLNWKTQLAWRITLEYKDRNNVNHVFDSKILADNIRIDETEYAPNPAPTAETTFFTLTAYGRPINGKYQINQKQVKVNVNQQPVSIINFSADKLLVNISSSDQLNLNYEVKNAYKVEITNIPSTTPLPLPNGSVQTTINKTTTFKLTVTGWGTNPPTAKKEITVFVYKTYDPISVGPAGSGNNFQALPLTRVNKRTGYIYVANNAAGKIYQVNQKTRLADIATLPGSVMALSKDGSFLFVMENPQNAPPVFYKYNASDTQTPLAKYSPNIPPSCVMIYSQSSQRLFTGLQHYFNNVYMFMVCDKSMDVDEVIKVGTSPCTFIFDENETYLYVANYDSKNISAIKNTPSYEVDTIPLLTSEPCDFARVGSTLFVACSGGNAIGIIDTATNTFKGEIIVGNRPFSLLFNLSNTRLYVANFGENTVSVIDVAKQQVLTTLTVGNAPSSMRISDDGGLLFVSNYCDKTLSVVDLSVDNGVVVGAIDLGNTNGNPLDISAFGTDNMYTDVFVAKENFKGRSEIDPGVMTDTILNMSVLSIQGKIGSTEDKGKSFLRHFLNYLQIGHKFIGKHFRRKK